MLDLIQRQPQLQRAMLPSSANRWPAGEALERPPRRPATCAIQIYLVPISPGHDQPHRLSATAVAKAGSTAAASSTSLKGILAGASREPPAAIDAAPNAEHGAGQEAGPTALPQWMIPHRLRNERSTSEASRCTCGELRTNSDSNLADKVSFWPLPMGLSVTRSGSNSSRNDRKDDRLLGLTAQQAPARAHPAR